MRQGCPLTEAQVRKMIYLLETTDMAMVDIATAMGCTRSTVSRINKHYKIRDYGKRRSSWNLAETKH